MAGAHRRAPPAGAGLSIWHPPAPEKVVRARKGSRGSRRVRGRRQGGPVRADQIRTTPIPGGVPARLPLRLTCFPKLPEEKPPRPEEPSARTATGAPLHLSRQTKCRWEVSQHTPRLSALARARSEPGRKAGWHLRRAIWRWDRAGRQTLCRAQQGAGWEGAPETTALGLPTSGL